MKKGILILLALLLIYPASADEWDNFTGIDRAWDGQKTVTNQEFEDVIDALQAKQKQKDAKKRKKLIKKVGGGGTSLHNELNPDKTITEIAPLKKNKDGLLLNIPVCMIIDDNILEKGFYNVFAEKDKNGDIYLSFYQSQFFKGKVRASETQDDYDSDVIDFVKFFPYDKHFIKIVYGSLDFNAYAYIRYLYEE